MCGLSCGLPLASCFACGRWRGPPFPSGGCPQVHNSMTLPPALHPFLFSNEIQADSRQPQYSSVAVGGRSSGCSLVLWRGSQQAGILELGGVNEIGERVLVIFRGAPDLLLAMVLIVWLPESRCCRTGPPASAPSPSVSLVDYF